MMNKCFVIQPFKELYNKRYKDVFKPAIEGAELEPYRVDEDLTSRILIDDIEEGIRDCEICFAEITTDNPNVWYELGYAFANGKDVVMVCSEDRKSEFPFDIRHRHIIKYSPESKSDFEDLQDQITEKIRAFLKKEKKVKQLGQSRLQEIEGLKDNEMNLMALIFEEQSIPDSDVAIHSLVYDMEKIGYTKFATNMAIRTLEKIGFIQTLKSYDDWNNHEYEACRLTSKGDDWLIENQDKFAFKIGEDERYSEEELDDDLPF